MATGRLGSVLNNFVSPAIARRNNTEGACWVGVFFNMLSLVMSIALLKLDQDTKKANAEFHKSVEVSAHAELTASLLLDSHEDDEISLPEDLQHYDNNKRSINYDNKSVGTSSTSISSSSRSRSDSTYNGDSEEISKEVKLSDIFRFGFLFWLLSFSCFAVYGCILPFNNIASSLLLERDYFKAPPIDCTLRFEDQCTSGTLAPIIGNPSTDENRNSCPGSHYAPVLPTILNYTKENGRWDDSWDEDEYVFDDIEESDVNCEDDFWAEACTKDYCDTKDDATVTAGR